MDDRSIGLTLERARHMAGMDDASSASALGTTRRRLRSIEQGRTPAPTAVVERAVAAYGRDLELPPRQDLLHPAEPGVLVVGSERIPVDAVRGDNRALLSRYLTAVRRQRGLDVGEPVPLRADDVVALARVLDLSAEDLEHELVALAGMSTPTATRTARLLVLTALCMVALGGTAELTRPADTAARPLFGVDAARARLVTTTASPFTVVARDRIGVAPALFTRVASSRTFEPMPLAADRSAGLWSVGTPPAERPDAVTAAPPMPALSPGGPDGGQRADDRG